MNRHKRRLRNPPSSPMLVSYSSGLCDDDRHTDACMTLGCLTWNCIPDLLAVERCEACDSTASGGSSPILPSLNYRPGATKAS